MNRLNIYQGRGIPTRLEEPKEWNKFIETIRADILHIPPLQEKKTKRRKILDENGRLCKRDQLKHLDE